MYHLAYLHSDSCVCDLYSWCATQWMYWIVLLSYNKNITGWVAGLIPSVSIFSLCVWQKMQDEVNCLVIRLTVNSDHRFECEPE